VPEQQIERLRFTKPWLGSDNASLCPWERHLMAYFPFWGPSSLPVVVAQLDKRPETEPFLLGVKWHQTQSIGVHTK